MRIGIIAAVPGELKQLVNTGGWTKKVTKRATRWTASQVDDEWVAVCAGIGAEAAQRAFAEAEEDGHLDIVLSVGWAGALNDDVSEKNVYIPSLVIDARTGERFELSGAERNLILVSSAVVANETEKRRLAETYGGAMVDMEGASILRLAEMREIPACCIKAISDGLALTLPDFNAFIDERGHLRIVPLAWHALLRPRFWKPLLQLGRTSSTASHVLASAILTFLTGPKNVMETNRTGSVNC